jgi:hypothetical protein
MDKDEKLREILKCERANLNCWDKHHPRLKQRITNLILTNDLIKKTDSNPCYNTKWMDEILSIESKLYMHMQGLDATEYHYLNVVPNSRVECAHREILSLAIDLDCMIIKQLKEISVHRSIIDSLFYAMYTRENFERWDSWFGSYSEYGLYSIFTNALKQSRRFQRDDCDEAHDEDDCNDDDDCWAEDCGLGFFSPVQRLDERSEAS